MKIWTTISNDKRIKNLIEIFHQLFVFEKNFFVCLEKLMIFNNSFCVSFRASFEMYLEIKKILTAF